jgi:UDP-4-amino-4,6-dideoxy-N-acetyl-beta-L-altrosamine transaminase
MEKFLPYSRQWIDEADIKAVGSVLRSNYLTQGPAIELFEESIKQITGAKYCVAVSNATQGLHIAVAALEIGEGAEGITTPITFVASANCLVSNNLTPIFADIDPKTYNIAPDEIEKKITSKTKVIVPVDFAGQAVDIDSIKQIADKYHLSIIEDAAHAIGSNYIDGKPVGCCHKADMTVFSFHPVKTITCGEGGAITTNSELLYKRLLKLRTIGITKDSAEMSKNPGPWYYEMQYLSGNYRMTDIQAALGRSQLSKLDFFKHRRRAIVNKYNAAFGTVPYITTPYEEENADSCFHLYVLQLDFQMLGKSRKQTMEELKEKGIGTQVHYIPVNSQPYYTKKAGTYIPGSFPAAEFYYGRCLTIPLYPAMKDSDVEYVISVISDLRQARAIYG